MHIQGILAVAISLFIGVSSLPQAVTDTAPSPNTVAASPQQPVITAPPNGAPTGGFDGSGREGWRNHKGSLVHNGQGQGGFQSDNVGVKDIQSGANPVGGGDLMPTNTFGSTVPTDAANAGGNPAGSFGGGPAASFGGAPVASVRGGPVASLGGSPVASLGAGPAGSFGGPPVASLGAGPAGSFGGPPVTTLGAGRSPSFATALASATS